MIIVDFYEFGVEKTQEFETLTKFYEWLEGLYKEIKDNITFNVADPKAASIIIDYIRIEKIESKSYLLFQERVAVSSLMNIIRVCIQGADNPEVRIKESQAELECKDAKNPVSEGLHKPVYQPY